MNGGTDPLLGGPHGPDQGRLPLAGAPGRPAAAGLGHSHDQDLRAIAEAKQQGRPLSDAQRAAWRRNPMLLSSEPDGVQAGHGVIAPQLPKQGSGRC